MGRSLPGSTPVGSGGAVSAVESRDAAMSVLLVLSAVEERHLHRALADHVARHGRDRVPDRILDLTDELGAIGGHSQPLAANGLSPDPRPGDGGLVTFTEAAEIAGVSKRTLSRWDLPKVGRRIPRTALLDAIEARR